MQDKVRNREMELAKEALGVLTQMRMDQLAARRAATASRNLAGVTHAQAAIDALDRAIADEFAHHEESKQAAKLQARKSLSNHLIL